MATKENRLCHGPMSMFGIISGVSRKLGSVMYNYISVCNSVSVACIAKHLSFLEALT